jgi:WD40 repeat protein
LHQLIDARLLTSFEERAPEEAGALARRRVEIVHESLLQAWPRLVRWQTQDADAAQLRDQLRQAAHLWGAKGRPDDLLWSGTSYQEYEVWHVRYPGGLSELEKAFASAMTALATRHRRRRRIALAAGFAVLLAVLAVVGTLWRRSVQEIRRAEAAKLLALAQARLADDATEALALTTASLEVADSREAREFVMRVLWTAPPALDLEMGGEQLPAPSFSPDGHHLAVAGLSTEVRVWSEDGRGPTILGGQSTKPENLPIWATEELVVVGKQEGIGGPGFGDRVQLWSVPEGTLLRAVEFGSPGFWTVGPGRLFVQIELGEGPSRRIELKSWRLPDGAEELLDSMTAKDLAGISDLVAAPDGSGWVVARGREVFLRPFGGGRPERLFDVLDTQASLVLFGDDGVLASDDAGNARLWSFAVGEPRRAWAIHRSAGATTALPDPTGRRFASLGQTRQSLRVWERAGLPGAGPLELRRSGAWYEPVFAFHPTGDWCVATTRTLRRLTFWSIARPYPSVIDAYDFPHYRKVLAFSPDSRWLATGSEEGVRLLPVGSGDLAVAREIRFPVAGPVSRIRFDPEGRYLLVVTLSDASIVPLDGGPFRRLVASDGRRQIEEGAISPSGSRVAIATWFGDGPCTLYVVDVATGARTSFDLPHPENQAGLSGGVMSLEFLDDQTLLTMGSGGIRRWDLANGAQELVVEMDGKSSMRPMRASRAAGTAITWAYGQDFGAGFELHDLVTGVSQRLQWFGDRVEAADIDPSGVVIATGSADGSIRVGRLDGGEPHLLPGHKGILYYVAVSPDLRWVASAGEDGTLRLWPMPDLDKPPLHTLPHDELLATLHSLTNLRAVRDPESSTGWTIELDPFPGWANVPTW